MPFKKCGCSSNGVGMPPFDCVKHDRTGGETVMVPLLGHDEEVEEASFMPRAFRSSDDNALRKWEARDLGIKSVGAELGGGSFGKQQQLNDVFWATYTRNSNTCNIR